MGRSEREELSAQFRPSICIQENTTNQSCHWWPCQGYGRKNTPAIYLPNYLLRGIYFSLYIFRVREGAI